MSLINWSVLTLSWHGDSICNPIPCNHWGVLIIFLNQDAIYASVSTSFLAIMYCDWTLRKGCLMGRWWGRGWNDRNEQRKVGVMKRREGLLSPQIWKLATPF